MTLREEVENWKANSWKYGGLLDAEYDRLLLALDTLEAVEWMERNDADLLRWLDGINMPCWSVRKGGYKASGVTTPEAVAALKSKLASPASEREGENTK